MSTHRRNTAAILGVAVLGLALGLGGTVALGSRDHESAEGGASVSAPGQTPLPAPAGTPPEAAPNVAPAAPAPDAGAVAPQPADPAPPADADGGNADQGEAGANDVAGEAEGEVPEPAQPQVPDIELDPDFEIDPPRFNPNPQPPANADEGGDENGAIPEQPEEQDEQEEQEEPELFDIPLHIYIQRAGPGPIWERDSEADCPNMTHREGTWVEFTIAQRPVHEPYEFRATATAGRAEGRARVTREPGPNGTYRINYSFARGSVLRPQPISYSITVIDAEGNRYTESLQATPGIGHRLFPHDYCPD